jgi:transcriptional regulator with XRE-family HTH domain
MGQAMRKKPLDQRDSEQLRALGSVIRDSRRGRLSLEELARRAGVSAGQLSQIENGTGNPSVEMLIRIAAALALGVTDLVERQSAAQTYVVRAGQRRRYRVVGMDHDVHLLTPGIRHQLSASYAVINPGEVWTTESHAGDTLIYVLKGELEIRKANTVYRARAHDSLIVPLPHTMTTASDELVEYIGVFRPEGS